MQVTYKLSADSLSSVLLDEIKAHFQGKEINITVEDADFLLPSDQMTTFQKMEEFRKALMTMKVDKNLDLSALANEVNI